MDLAEMAAVGPAEVLSIDESPRIDPGPGRLITGTFHHTAAAVYNLKVESESEPFGVTGTHPFWSVDRQAWVAVADLKVGETLKTLEGTTVVESIGRRPDPERVCNIEVEGDHVYRVGTSGVLVHNASTQKHLHAISGNGDSCYHYAESAAAKRRASTDNTASACLKNWAALRYQRKDKTEPEPIKWFLGSAGALNHAEVQMDRFVRDKLEKCEITILEVFTERSPCPRQCAAIVGEWLDYGAFRICYIVPAQSLADDPTETASSKELCDKYAKFGLSLR